MYTTRIYDLTGRRLEENEVSAFQGECHRRHRHSSSSYVNNINNYCNNAYNIFRRTKHEQLLLL